MVSLAATNLLRGPNPVRSSRPGMSDRIMPGMVIAWPAGIQTQATLASYEAATLPKSKPYLAKIRMSVHDPAGRIAVSGETHAIIGSGEKARQKLMAARSCELR